jgi:uncharacterized secreted protein with C-terminal beta-propeller domain
MCLINVKAKELFLQKFITNIYMKRLAFYLAFFTATLLVSCSGNGPEGAAKSFITHTSKGEFEEAKKFSTESTAAFLSMAQQLGAEQLKQMKEKNKDVKVEIVSSDVKDSTATVTYKLSGIEGVNNSDSQLELVKKDGEWKVDMGFGAPQGPPPAAQ